MESEPLLMALKAATIIVDPVRLLFLAAGVLMGLIIGIIPGLGGLLGLSLLLPFTFGMDPFTALAMMLGLSAVTVTSDTIPAVLFSVPGTVGSAATILDCFPMARKGEADRALGAAFSASVLGGLFGALVLGLSIPVLKPLVLLIGSPELLAICIFGLSLVAVLSGGSPLTGMAAVCVGILVSTTGEDPQTATLRWTFDTSYLWDGLPIVPFALGLFAIPEIADMVIARQTIAAEGAVGSRWAQVRGFRDVLRHYWLVIRCSSIGAILGAIPGMGAAVIDWIAYGHAARSEKGADQTFGKGDVRGVIASESSNNAKEGGALIPTIAFGVPGSASMALLLGAFIIHDIVPGPELLTKRLDVTYTLVWSIAIANVLGAGICFLFANQLAKIALVRIGILGPIILAVVYVGVFQASNSWGDLLALMVFGFLGWVMKRMGWPRPPMILGFVLGGLIERYMFISIMRYDFEWLKFPIVMALFALTLFGLVRPIIRDYREGKKKTRSSIRLDLKPGAPSPETIFTLAIIALFIVCLTVSSQWEFGGKLVPQVAGWGGLVFAGIHLLGRFFTFEKAGVNMKGQAPESTGDSPDTGRKKNLHFDTSSDFQDLTRKMMLSRAGIFFGWCLFYLVATAIVGLLPAMLFFLIGYIRLDGRESWKVTLAVSLPTLIFAYVLFHRFLRVVWPQSLLGDMFPFLRSMAMLNIF
ncbi:MAG: tripartite tricarboxylate transporter permease [Deltaproteobacteria bacterium]|nr:tripartite tricarboxylate transporter permease [Deltaproteobacteria bacterium]